MSLVTLDTSNSFGHFYYELLMTFLNYNGHFIDLFIQNLI
jgi:hypothetical protein